MHAQTSVIPTRENPERIALESRANPTLRDGAWKVLKDSRIFAVLCTPADIVGWITCDDDGAYTATPRIGKSARFLDAETAAAFLETSRGGAS